MTLEWRGNRALRGAGLVLFYGALILIAVWLGCSRDTTPPGAPDGLTITTDSNDDTPSFTWVAAADEGSGVAHYLVRMDEGSWSKLGDMTTCDWGSPLSDGTHRFEVRAADKQGNEGVSASLTFFVDTAPPAKTYLMSPASGYCTGDTTPSFEWAPASDASGVTYQLQIDDNDDFSSPSVNVHGLVNASYTLSQYLALVDGDYYWRVCTVDGLGQESEWTNGRSFTLNTGLPPMPWRVSPTNGTETDDSKPSFDWSDVCAPSGVSYWLQIAYDQDFSSLVLDASSLNISEYTLTDAQALADGKYYWRVCAVDTLGGQSDWTSGWSITINTP
ncbi:MAG: fibronectin type III domain-containing protein [Dehalococcoidia bacterium]|nr:fibronectin type III domain-containing protein [Dehalococcoidia bacterium]